MQGKRPTTCPHGASPYPACVENPKPPGRALVWSQIAYFLFVFPWLVIAATATQLSIEPALVRSLYLAWLWVYPLLWVASLLMTHRNYSRDQLHVATRWNLLPLTWIVPTVLIGFASAAL